MTRRERDRRGTRFSGARLFLTLTLCGGSTLLADCVGSSDSVPPIGGFRRRWVRRIGGLRLWRLRFDVSGNNQRFTPASSTPPIRLDNALGAMPAISFNGTSQNLSRAGVLGIDPTSARTVAVYA